MSYTATRKDDCQGGGSRLLVGGLVGNPVRPMTYLPDFKTREATKL